MKYKAETTGTSKIVILHCDPNWLERLFGSEYKIVYAQCGKTHLGWPVWILSSGREVTSGMLDAIDKLPLSVELRK